MNLKNLAHTWRYHLIILVAAVLTIVVGGYIRRAISGDEKSENSLLRTLQTEVQQLRSTLRRNELKTIQQDVAELAMGVQPRVVSIVGAKESRRPIVTLTDALPESRRVSIRDERPGGSGLLLDREGHILTSAAVAEDPSGFIVRFGDGIERPARLLATDPVERLALLKLERVDDLPAAAPLNAPAPPQIGGWLVRLGRSADGRNSLSMGLLTTIRKDLSGEEVYAIDAQFAPELDGGPAIDLDGGIVGINIAHGGGVTIPVDRVIRAIDRLRSRAAKSPRSAIGIELQDLTGEMKKMLSVEHGALVTRVLPEGPAAEAGIEPMDAIIFTGQEPVNSAAALLERIHAAVPGSALQMTVLRSGTTRTIEVRTVQQSSADRAGRIQPDSEFGLSLFRQRDPDGVRIVAVEPDSPADRLGLRAGDRILSVNGRQIRGFVEFQRASTEPSQLWLVRRGDQTFGITIRQEGANR